MEVKFKIIADKKDHISNNLINCTLQIIINSDIYNFIIKSYLGSGAIGMVYLLSPIEKLDLFGDHKHYVIKISNLDCYDNLLEETHNMVQLFNTHNIQHSSYPLCYGKFDNKFIIEGTKTTNKLIGVLYNYFGYYNLEKIKSIYIISFKDNINIIKEIVKQLISLKSIVHCDLKPCNIAINIINNTFIPTIIDFGLCRSYNSYDIISTNYITSPESLLTLEEFRDNCKYDISKHDYFGLFSIIINMFTKDGYWNIITKYLIETLKIKKNLVLDPHSREIFVYMWCKFDTSSTIHTNLIKKIETKYTFLNSTVFISFDIFFEQFIVPDIISINITKYNDFKDFLQKLIRVNMKDRPELETILEHPFLKD